MVLQSDGYGDVHDVVVVGAGLVGAAIANRLQQEGCKTAILEARRVAGAATGRSLGVASLGLTGTYSWAVSVYGRERAREIWTLTAGGRERLVEAARRVGVSFQRSGTEALAADDREADLLWESAKLLQEDGFGASFSLTDLVDLGFEAALRSADDVTVDAAALTSALVRGTGIQVHEGVEVYGLEPAEGGVRVWAHGRHVYCRHVVLAVNGYSALLDPYLAEYVAPLLYRVLVIEPAQKVSLERPCIVDYGRGVLRSLPDGRLLLGLCQLQTSRAAPPGSRRSTAELVRGWIPELDLARADGWSEVVGGTPDGLPMLGQLPGLPRVHFAAGFQGRGLSWAFVVAERLVAAMLHGVDPGLLSAKRLTHDA